MEYCLRCGDVRRYIPADLRRAYAFFREHAGYVVGQAAKCAYDLAKAEIRAERDGLVFDWQEDPEPAWSDDGHGGNGCKDHSHYGCIMRLPDDPKSHLASVWSVCADHGDPYRRVVQAELAAEHYCNEDRADAIMHT